MKNILIIGGFLLITWSAAAQTKMNMNEMFPNGIIYKTADGKVIPADKLDSIKKTLGAKVQYMHKKSEPGVMYLIAQSLAGQKAETASKDKFAAMIGKPAPYFSLKDVKGQTYNLALLKGKVVVLNFWFIACSGCVAEMPDLNAIKAVYSPDKVVFLAMALDQTDQIRKFQKTHDFRYALIPDARKVHQDYGIYACPVSMVIGRDGVMSYISGAGEQVDKSLPKAINAELDSVTAR